MRFDFLKATGHAAVSKEFTKTSDGFETKPYPFVKNFDSFSESANNCKELFEIIKHHSQSGHTAIKGLLTSPLSNQSRAGKTVANDTTNWIMLDLDFEDGFSSIDEFLLSLSPDLINTDYIFQHSSSAGVKYKQGIRGHIFMLLDKPVSPLVIKEWLISKNLNIPTLSDRIELAANSLSIKYPLDISTCQNDKLLFIADPICINFTDPLQGNRLELHLKSNRTASINFQGANAASNRQASNNKIDELRVAKGLKKKKSIFKFIGEDEILTNPDEAIVSGVKHERGFVYLNLNSGNSWGYYYPENKPDILYNFKNEPPVLLKDIAPEYWRTIQKQTTKQVSTAVTPIVFRDRESDTYWNGTYTATKNEINIYPVSSTQRINHFLAQYGIQNPSYIEDWELTFNPTTNKVIDIPNKWVNKFSPSSYMLQTNGTNIGIPPTIDKVIASVCGDDPVVKEHFLNWLAYIFQTRKKTGTGFVFHGRTGTGKGIMFDKIIRPLIGDKYVTELTVDNLSDQFNQWLETSIIIWLDEFNADDSHSGDALMNKIKNLVTENTVTIRGMRRNPIQKQVYNNIIIASNHTTPIPIDINDRRFNISPAQESMIVISQTEIDQIKNELTDFATFLHEFKVNVQKTKQVLNNDAKQKMIAASMTSHNSFFEAVRKGDLEYFVQFLREKAPLSPDNSYIEFERAVKRWTANAGTQITVTRDELSAAYAYLQHTKNPSPTKFARMCSINRIQIASCRLDGKPVKGVKMVFEDNLDDDVKENVTTPKIIGLPNVN